MTRGDSGVTLLELLIVLAIFGLVAAGGGALMRERAGDGRTQALIELRQKVKAARLRALTRRSVERVTIDAHPPCRQSGGPNIILANNFGLVSPGEICVLIDDDPTLFELDWLTGDVRLPENS